MSQSISQLYVHAIFHIKNHDTFIQEKDFKELYAYIGGVINSTGCTPIIINGTKDHIHILFILSKNISLVKTIQELKQSSSRWIKTKDNYYRCFEWQSGYGAFSVSPSVLDTTKRYIINQVKHHAKRSFQEEYKLFLDEYGVDYDEKYLWT